MPSVLHTQCAMAARTCRSRSCQMQHEGKRLAAGKQVAWGKRLDQRLGCSRRAVG